MFAKWAHARPLRHASRKLLYSQGCRRCAQRASPHEESGSVREQGGFVDLSQRVEARQELRLTAELRQGIEIMQMSAVELSDYVKQRVEENPFLDDDDWLYPQHPYEADTYTRTVSTDELAGSSRAAARERAVNGGDADEVRDAERWRSGQDARWGGSSSSSLAAGEGFAWDDYFVEGETLADHLTEQLRLQEDDPRRIAVGELIAGSLDDDGYLTIPLEGIARSAGVSKAEAADVLRTVQRLDPVGVGVRNLAERLAVQLAVRGLYEKPHVKKLVEEGINDLGRLAPAPLAKKLGITVEELDEAFDLLQTCNPHPAAQFGKASASIWPEIVVEPADEPGTYRVRLQDCFLPHLQINAHYRTLAQTEKNRATEEYLKKMLKEGEFASLTMKVMVEKILYCKTPELTDELVREHFAPATTVEEFRGGVAKQFGLPDMAKEDPQFPDLVLGELAKRLVEDPDPADRMDGMPDDALRIMCAIDALAAHLDLDLTDEQVIAQMPGDDAEQREKIFKQLKDQGLEAEGRKFALREAALGWLVNNSRVSFK